MDRNTIIGLGIIFVLFIIWQQMLAPTPAQLEAEQARIDSLARIEQVATTPTPSADTGVVSSATDSTALGSDSVRVAQLGGTFGPFAAAAVGSADSITLKNDLMSVTFSTLGGRITRVELLEYAKIVEDEDKNEFRRPLYLLEDSKNRFEYLLPVAGLPAGGVRTGNLYFVPQVDGQRVTFRATAGDGRYFEQTYALTDGSYLVDYDLRFEGMDQVLDRGARTVQLEWENYLDRIEINHSYERNYSTVYYKPVNDDTDYCSCTSDDTEELDNTRIKWVSHSNQFFNSTLLADSDFSAATLETQVIDESQPDLKLLRSRLTIPLEQSASQTFGMQMYIGPNDFEILQAVGHDMSDIISFGNSIFGAINRWVIRPIFNFLTGFISNKGIAILVLTFFVKLLVYPLTYKMLYSQSKMQAMKPFLEKAKAKHKGDQQAQQMETMKLYREYGVSPLGGCLPMLLQLPIWFALYRFFPASITFRQADFLWANDLSSYDVFMRLPFEVPFGFGSHLSLFAILWAITTLIYTYYNTKHMDYSAQPAMKYMQYIMPVFFLGFFNSFASGLTAYLLFSNLFNIGQTIVTKNYIINQDKVRAELESNFQKPKKKTGFQARLEEALREQQRRQADMEQQKDNNARKRKK